MRRVANLELGGVLKKVIRCASRGGVVYLPELIIPSLSYTAAFPLASSFKKEEEEEKEDLHQFSLTPDILSQEDPRLGALNIGACALAVIVLSICSRTIFEGGSGRNFSGCAPMQIRHRGF